MNILKNFSFKTKLIALCVMLSTVSVLVGSVSYWGLHKVQDSFKPITQTNMPNLELANDMYSAFREIRINLRSLGLPGLPKDDEVDFIKKVKENIAKYEASASAYEEITFVPGEKEVWDKLTTEWSKFKAVGTKVLELQAKDTPEARQAMIEIFLKDCPDSARGYGVAMGGFLDFQNTQIS